MTKLEEYAKTTDFLTIRDDIRTFGMIVISCKLKYFKIDYNSVTGYLSIYAVPFINILDSERNLFISEFEKISEAKDKIENILNNIQ